MQVDAEAIQTLILGALPRRVRWMIRDTPVDYDFSTAQDGVQPLSRDHVGSGNVEDGWRDLLVFGEYDYAEGGGARPFLCVSRTDGRVFEFDIEHHDSQIRLLNSTIDRFVETFLYINEFLHKGERLPTETGSRLRFIDPDAYASSEWQSLLECLDDR